MNIGKKNTLKKIQKRRPKICSAVMEGPFSKYLTLDFSIPIELIVRILEKIIIVEHEIRPCIFNETFPCIG